MTRNEMVTLMYLVFSCTQEDDDDLTSVDKLRWQLPHTRLSDRMYYDPRNLAAPQIIDEAIAAEKYYIDILHRHKSFARHTEEFRDWLEEGLDYEGMERLVRLLRDPETSVHDGAKMIRRLTWELPHASIGDLIFRDTVGLTPAQVVDEAVRRQRDHLSQLVEQMKRA